jgi:hypothetical protein
MVGTIDSSIGRRIENLVPLPRWTRCGWRRGFLHGGLHHVHADAAAGHAGSHFLGRETRQEYQLQAIVGGQRLVFGDQALCSALLRSMTGSMPLPSSCSTIMTLLLPAS